MKNWKLIEAAVKANIARVNATGSDGYAVTLGTFMSMLDRAMSYPDECPKILVRLQEMADGNG